MNPFLTQCAWCRRIKDGTDYVPASPVPWAEVSHGICPECLAKQFAAMREDTNLATRLRAEAA
jgi:hypothetical protein